MGYDLHIARTQLWFNSEDDPITLYEWKAYVAGGPEMSLEGEAEVPIPDGGLLVYKNSGLAVWTKYSGHGRKGNKAWLDHFKGEISVKNRSGNCAEDARRRQSAQCRIGGRRGRGLYRCPGVRAQLSEMRAR